MGIERRLSILSPRITYLTRITGREGRDKWEDREVDELKRQKALLEARLAEQRRGAPNRQSVVELETK